MMLEVKGSGEKGGEIYFAWLNYGRGKEFF